MFGRHRFIIVYIPAWFSWQFYFHYAINFLSICIKETHLSQSVGNNHKMHMQLIVINSNRLINMMSALFILYDFPKCPLHSLHEYHSLIENRQTVDKITKWVCKWQSYFCVIFFSFNFTTQFSLCHKFIHFIKMLCYIVFPLEVKTVIEHVLHVRLLVLKSVGEIIIDIRYWTLISLTPSLLDI